MLNPSKNYIKSNGIDLPIMYVYLAGRIAGNCIEKCLSWRMSIINFYSNYKGKGTYPIAFLDALNSKESDSVDKLGLTSALPPNLIYDKDILSVERADVIVANLDDYFEEGLEWSKEIALMNKEDLMQRVNDLQNKILNRRENFGTISEVAIAMYLKKPVILIVPEKRKYIYEKHPFAKRASVIVGSVEELLEKKWLNILYKSISSAIY